MHAVDSLQEEKKEKMWWWRLSCIEELSYYCTVLLCKFRLQRYAKYSMIHAMLEEEILRPEVPNPQILHADEPFIQC